MVGDDAEEGARRVRQPDVVTALITTALALVIGLLVINMLRGDTARATTGAAIVISFALTAQRSQRDQ